MISHVSCYKISYTKQVIFLIIFNVVTTLPFSTLIFNSLTINVRICAKRYVGIFLSSLFCWFFFHILTNTKFKYVTSTYYDSWYIVYELTSNVTYCHRIIDIYSMCSYLVYQTLNIIFNIVTFSSRLDWQGTNSKGEFQCRPLAHYIIQYKWWNVFPCTQA